MSTVTLTLPKEYGFVLATVGLTMANSIWHAIRIGRFRKASGVAYPTPYADSAMLDAATTPERKLALHKFNCAQRSHGNFLESSPMIMIAALVAGARYPVAAAATAAVWNAGRVWYTIGYNEDTVGTGKGRIYGSAIGFLSLFGLVGMVGSTAAAWLGYL